MGEAAVLAAFNLEFSKVLKGAPLGAKFHNPVARKLAELLEHFTPKLSVSTFAPRLLQLGDLLLKREAFQLARGSCFSPLVRATSASKTGDSLHLQLLTYNIQARYGAALCALLQLRNEDPGLRNPKTLEKSLGALGEITGAMHDAQLDQEELYWLVLNGTVHIWSAVQPLMTASFGAEALDPLVWAIAGMESQICLCTARYLEWRCQLYVTAGECYFLAGLPDKAKACAERGLSKVRELEDLQRLDPVPPLPETVEAYTSVRRTMQLACFQYGDQSSTVTSETVAQNLAQTFAEPADRILALAMALDDPTRRVLSQTAPTSYQKVLLTCASNLLASPLAEIVTSAQGFDTPRSDESGDLSSRESAPAASFELDSVLPIKLHQQLLQSAFTYREWALFENLVSAADVRIKQASESAASFSAVVDFLKAVRELQREGKSREGLVALGRAIGVCGAESAARDGEVHTDAVLFLWGEVKYLLAGRDGEATRKASMRNELSNFEPDTDTSASLDQTEGKNEEGTQRLIFLLATLHDASERLDVQDALMRAQIALRLASLLGSQVDSTGKGEARDLERGIEVLQSALRTVERFRDLDAQVRAHDDVSNRSWIEAREEGEGDEAQKLLRSCHVDLLATYYRLWLRLGAHGESVLATVRLGREEQTLKKREQQASIFGAMTLKEKKEAQEKLARLGRAPPFSVKAEKELLSECNSNPYQRALALMQMAATRPSQADRALLLQQSQAELENARALEVATSLCALPSQGAKPRGIPPPQIVTRTSKSVTIRPGGAFTLRARSGKVSGGRQSAEEKPAAYAVFGKVAGSGVAVSLHNTDFPGTGAHARVPLSDVITLSGLSPNEQYMFALAFYDKNGDLIDTIGPSTSPFTLALPLPKLQCQAYVALTAHKLGCPKEASSTARPVIAHFVENVAVDEDGVERLFGDQLRVKAARESPTTLLRSFVQILFIESEVSPEPLRPANPSQTAHSLLPSQLERLQQAHRLLIAAQAAALCEYPPLICEAATRSYNRVVPLLAALPEKCPVIQPLLASCHTVLASCQGTAGITESAGHVAAGLTFQLFRRLKAIGERGAARGIGKMDLKVLLTPEKKTAQGQGEDGLVNDGPGIVEKESGNRSEVPLLEEVLLSDSEWATFENEVIANRSRDPTDAAAQVLGVLLHQTDGCEKAWAALRGELFQHPQFVELAVRTLEKAAKEGGQEKVVLWGGDLVEIVRARSRRPVFIAPEQKEQEPDSKGGSKGTKGAKEDAKKLTRKASTKEDRRGSRATPSRNGPSEGGSEMSSNGLLLNEGMSPEQAALEQKRVAAASVLQRHVLARLAWKKEVRKTREWVVQNGGWIARLYMVLGAAALGMEIAHKEGHVAARMESASSVPEGKFSPDKRRESNSKTSRPPSASVKDSGGKAKNTRDKAMAGTPVPADTQAAAGVNPRSWWTFTPASAVHFSRAGQHAFRSGAAVELQNAARAFSNARVVGASTCVSAQKADREQNGRSGAESESPPRAKEGDGYEKRGLAKAAFLLASALADSATTNSLTWEDGAVTPEPADGHIRSFTKDALQALSANQLWTRVLELGMALSASDGADKVLPYMVTAANALGEEACQDMGISSAVLARDLQGSLKARGPALEALQECRRQWREGVRSAGGKETPDVESWPLGEDRTAGDAKGAEPGIVGACTRAVAMLQACPDTFLLAQAHNELGDIQAHFGDFAAASRSWNNCLDTITGAYKSLGKWRQLVASESGKTASEASKERAQNPQEVRTGRGRNQKKELGRTGGNARWLHVLGTCGGWRGCLLGANVLAKLLTSSLADDAHSQREAALMACEMTSAVFGMSIAHPQKLLEFAAYTPDALSWGQVSLFEDAYVSSVTRLQQTLFTLATQLISVHGEPLKALPVLSLLRGVLNAAIRDPPADNAAALLHIEALTAIGRLSEAFAELYRFFTPTTEHGANTTTDPVKATGKEAKSKAVTPDPTTAQSTDREKPGYANNLPPSHVGNQEALTFLATASLTAALATCHVSAGLDLARAHFLKRVGFLWETGQSGNLESEPAAEPASSNQRPGSQLGGKGSNFGKAEPKNKRVSVAASQNVTGGSACLTHAELLVRKALLDVESALKEAAAESTGLETLTTVSGQSGFAPSSLEILVKGDLLLADILCAQYRPKAALDAIRSALARFPNDSPPADASSKLDGVNWPLRHVVLCNYWLEAKLQTAELLLQLGHFTLARAASEQLEAQASTAGSVKYTLRAQSVIAEVDLQEGAIDKGFEGLSAVVAQCREHNYGEGHFLPVQLLKLAALARTEGLDTNCAEALYSEACGLLMCQEAELGFNDVQRKGALKSVYLPSTEMLAIGLLLQGSALLEDHAKVESALSLLLESERLLALSVASPPSSFVARAHLQLARAFLQVGQSAKAADRLRTAVKTTVQDGSHDRGLLREAFTLLAFIAASSESDGVEGQGLGVSDTTLAGALLNGRAVADMSGFLETNGAELAANLQNPEAMPPFALEHIRASEEYRLALRNGTQGDGTRDGGESGQSLTATGDGKQNGRPNPETLPGRDLGQLLFSYYRQLIREQQRQVSDMQKARAMDAQVRDVHRFLLASCPLYAEKCCWKKVPTFETAAPIPPGLVACAWVRMPSGSPQKDGPTSLRTGLEGGSLTLVYLVAPSDVVQGVRRITDLEELTSLRLGCKTVAASGSLESARLIEHDRINVVELLGRFCRAVLGVTSGEDGGTNEIGHEGDALSLVSALDGFLDFQKGFSAVNKTLADWLTARISGSKTEHNQ